MIFRSEEFINAVIAAIIEYQSEELVSDRELSLKAGLSPTMVSKIKNKTTIPKLGTIRKLRDAGVPVRKFMTK